LYLPDPKRVNARKPKVKPLISPIIPLIEHKMILKIIGALTSQIKREKFNLG